MLSYDVYSDALGINVCCWYFTLGAGERPDTVYLSDLPCKWFSDQKSSSSESTLVVKPSEQRVNDVFSQFGTIRVMDIPLLDPYR